MAANSYGWMSQPSRMRGDPMAPPTSQGYGGYGGQQGGFQNSPYGSFNSYDGGQRPPTTQGNYTDMGGRTFNQGQDYLRQNAPYQASPYGGQGPNPMQSQWDKQAGFDYGNKDSRMAANSYSDNYLQPYMNYNLQREDQQYNQYADQRNFGSQQEMNRFNMGLQGRDANRQDTAMGFGMYTNERDYGENRRQFDVRQGYDDRALGQQGQLTREGYRSQQDIAAMNNAAQRYGYDTQARTAQGAQAVDRYGIDTGYRTASMQNDTNRYGIDANSRTASMQNDTNRYGMDMQNQQFQGRLGLDTELGRGDLGLRGQTEGRMGRQQNLDESYRRDAMSQEAALMREKYQNDMMQSRYSAFGRAQAPSMQMRGGFR